MKKLSVSMTPAEVFWGWLYLPVQLIALPIILEVICMLLGLPLSASGLNFLYFCVNFAGVVILFRKFLVSSAKLSLSAPWVCLRSAFIGLAMYWLLSYVLSYITYLIYPDFSNVNDSSIGELVLENSALISFGTILLVPVAEETLYRGLLFGTVYNRSRIGAYVLSTVCFAALHVVDYIGYYPAAQLLLCFVQYIPAGLCLAWAYAKADSIWAPIVMHITINQIGILSMR